MFSNEYWLKGDNIFLGFSHFLLDALFSLSGSGSACFSSGHPAPFSRASAQPGSSQCISLQRTIPFKEQVFASVLVEFDKVPVSPLLLFCVGPPVRQLCSQVH